VARRGRGHRERDPHRKGTADSPFDLDGRAVPTITAYLFHDGGHESPAVLGANAGKSFIGSYVLGMGFTFDDTDTKGVASPLAEMHRLIAKDPRNAERIFPHIGGEELNSSPTQTHHRYVINFDDMSETEARQWPDLMAVVEAKVRPERMAQKDEGAKEKWWQFIRPRPELHEAIRHLDRVLVIARVSNTFALTFMPSGMAFNEKIVVFASDRDSLFAVLQSRIHEVWGRFFNTTLKDDMQYTPSKCFETFPFPERWEQSAQLQSAGRAYRECRAALMVRNDEGLTETYNRFHDRKEQVPEIAKLRELHAAMDRAVLDAYGWTDIQPTCEYFLDYEELENDEDGEGGGKKHREPGRFRWPDDVNDELLARLVALNRERAEAERLAGEAAQATATKAARPRRGRKTTVGRDSPQSSLLTG
jgi:hypothetical protein